jgi:hypothetical protein
MSGNSASTNASIYAWEIEDQNSFTLECESPNDYECKDFQYSRFHVKKAIQLKVWYKSNEFVNPIIILQDYIAENKTELVVDTEKTRINPNTKIAWITANLNSNPGWYTIYVEPFARGHHLIIETENKPWPAKTSNPSGSISYGTPFNWVVVISITVGAAAVVIVILLWILGKINNQRHKNNEQNDPLLELSEIEQISTSGFLQ